MNVVVYDFFFCKAVYTILYGSELDVDSTAFQTALYGAVFAIVVVAVHGRVSYSVLVSVSMTAGLCVEVDGALELKEFVIFEFLSASLKHDVFSLWRH